MTIHLLYLPQKTLRHCLIFYDASLYFCVMSYLNIMLCNVMQRVVVNSTPNDFKNPPEYIPDEFSSWWNVWISHLALLVKLPLKIRSIIQSNWKRKTKEFISLPKSYCSATTTIVHCRWMSYELLMYIQIRVYVYWLRRVMLLYGFREGHKLQSLIKTTSSSQI